MVSEVSQVRLGMLSAAELVSTSVPSGLPAPSPLEGLAALGRPVGFPFSAKGVELLDSLSRKAGFGDLQESIAECKSLRDSAFLAGADRARWGEDGGAFPLYEEPAFHWVLLLDAALWNALLSSGDFSRCGPMLEAQGGDSGVAAPVFPGAVRLIQPHSGAEWPAGLPEGLRPYEKGGEGFERARAFYSNPSSPGFGLFLLGLLTGGVPESRVLSPQEVGDASIFGESLLRFPDSPIPAGLEPPVERSLPSLAEILLWDASQGGLEES